MAHIETRMDHRISFGMTGGPTWQTEITALDSGVEYANQNWSQSRAKYEISYDAKRPEVFDLLLNHFMAVGGMANSFRVKDWIDFSATVTQGVFAMLTATTFQLYKRYIFGSLTYNRKIQQPVSSITVIGGSGVSVDYSTGVVTVSGGTPTAWYGDFDVPCRFASDVMQAVVINRSLAAGYITSWQSVQLIEVRLP